MNCERCKIKLTDDKWTEGMANFHADIVFCSLHESAQELLDAVESYRKFAERNNMPATLKNLTEIIERATHE